MFPSIAFVRCSFTPLSERIFCSFFTSTSCTVQPSLTAIAAAVPDASPVSTHAGMNRMIAHPRPEAETILPAAKTLDSLSVINPSYGNSYTVAGLSRDAITQPIEESMVYSASYFNSSVPTSLLVIRNCGMNGSEIMAKSSRRFFFRKSSARPRDRRIYSFTPSVVVPSQVRSSFSSPAPPLGTSPSQRIGTARSISPSSIPRFMISKSSSWNQWDTIVFNVSVSAPAR